MKHEAHQSATSLPAAPEQEVDRRSTRYLIMMGVRVVCFALMVLVHPYGWYTWVFCAAAVFLPYIAVVLANVGQESKTPTAVDPEKSLPSAPPASGPQGPTVIRVDEAKHLQSGAPATDDPPRHGSDG